MESILKYIPFSLEVGIVLGTILAALIAFTIIFNVAYYVKPRPLYKKFVEQINFWWVLYVFAVLVFFINRIMAFVGIALVSFIALREALSAMNLRMNDRYAIFWAYLSIPVQYYLAYIGSYYLFLIFIPVIMFIVIPIRTMIQGDTNGIIRSMAILQWTLMLTVYSISHMALLLTVDLSDLSTVGSEGLFLFLIVLTQMNDVFQFVWGKTFKLGSVTPRISPDKTWGGVIGGFTSTVILAYFIRFLTPFSDVQAIVAGFIIALAGFGGDLNIKSIKRDLGVKRFGDLIPGHGGVLDRIDSLCFSSLVFFHLVFFWFRVV